MGDLNTDLISRTGHDNRALQAMIDDLGLASCADARWSASSCVFKTHKGDEAHAPPHIDYILISKHSATAVRRFGIDADRDLMVDFDHAVLFADIDMYQVLGLRRKAPLSRLQWHMLECGLPDEAAIRTRWHTAVRAALSKRIKRRDVVDGVMACWATTAGRFHTVAGDQSRGWRAPPMVKEADSGCWSPDPAAPPPCFSPTTRQSGAGGGAETDSGGDEIDLTGDPTELPDSSTRTTATITTAKCPVDYNVDWDGVEGAAAPCLAAVKLLHKNLVVGQNAA